MPLFCSILLCFQPTKSFPELWCSLFMYMSHLDNSFQVREVRALCFKRFLAYSWFCLVLYGLYVTMNMRSACVCCLVRKCDCCR